MKTNILFALLIGLLISNQVFAEVYELIDYLYYEVDSSKSNKQSLKERLNTASPIRLNNEIQHSFTRWKVTWKIETEKKIEKLPNTLCNVTNVKVNVDALIHLPELKGEKNALLQKEFNRYTAKLQSHEVGHYMLFAIQAANKIDVQLPNMAPSENCNKLEKEANKIAENILSNYIEKEKEFDFATGFGRK